MEKNDAGERTKHLIRDTREQAYDEFMPTIVEAFRGAVGRFIPLEMVEKSFSLFFPFISIIIGRFIPEDKSWSRDADAIRTRFFAEWRKQAKGEKITEGGTRSKKSAKDYSLDEQRIAGFIQKMLHLRSFKAKNNFSLVFIQLSDGHKAELVQQQGDWNDAKLVQFWENCRSAEFLKKKMGFSEEEEKKSPATEAKKEPTVMSVQELALKGLIAFLSSPSGSNEQKKVKVKIEKFFDHLSESQREIFLELAKNWGNKEWKKFVQFSEEDIKTISKLIEDKGKVKEAGEEFLNWLEEKLKKREIDQKKKREENATRARELAQQNEKKLRAVLSFSLKQ